jgi:GxxExxY protein
MPIIPAIPLVHLSQEEFAPIAYDVLRCAFDLHREFGRFFDERIYKEELFRRLPQTHLEVPVQVVFDSFTKCYYLDVVIGDGALFEIKTVERLISRHRAQSLHYLHLSELSHAKLINMRPESVEHEFVNTSLDHASRLKFSLVTDDSFEATPGGRRLKQILMEVLYDWGAGLERALYEEALTHFLGGENQVCHQVAVKSGGMDLGQQTMRLAAPRSAFEVTALASKRASFVEHARRGLAHLDLDAILWVNITAHEVSLTALRR